MSTDRMTPSLRSPQANESATLTFWFPMPPVESTNASYSGHWSSRRKKTKAFLEQLDTRQAVRLHIPPPPPAPFPRARLTAVYHVRSRRAFMDRDGRTARLKRVLDWLVQRGYVVDDDDDHLDYEIPKQVVRTAMVPSLCSLHVTLTSLPQES